MNNFNGMSDYLLEQQVEIEFVKRKMGWQIRAADFMRDGQLTDAELRQEIRVELVEAARLIEARRRGAARAEAAAIPMPAPTAERPTQQARPAQAHRTGGRRDLLAPVIERAQQMCSDPFDAPAVWAHLRTLAEEEAVPLLGTTEDGVQWMDQKDDVQYLSKKALADRLRRAKTR